MRSASLGRAGLPASRIGLGLAALGRPGYINLGHAKDLQEDYAVERMQTRAFAVLDAAYEAGVRYLDAARSYGRAEQFLSAWLKARGHPVDALTVGSKWGYKYTADWRVQAEKHEIKEHSLKRFEDQWPRSKALLSPALKLYQIHSATLASGVLQNSDVLDALAELKSEGVSIGLSTSGVAQSQTIDAALQLRVDGAPLFDTVQSTWNVLEVSAQASLQRCKDAGLGVIIKEAVANGRLTAKNEAPEFAKARAQLEAIASAHEVTIDAIAIAAALAQPFVDVVLSGAATQTHLCQNLRADSLTLTESDLKRLESLRQAPDTYWDIRGRLPWN